MAVSFCTLAIHAPYRLRARRLCADAPAVPWVVLTDEPDDFADLPVRAIRHSPTGPMAVDYLTHLPPTGEGRGAAAYHDKRFALLAALEDFDTAIYVDADSRIGSLPRLGVFPTGHFRASGRAQKRRRAFERRAARGGGRCSRNWRVI